MRQRPGSSRRPRLTIQPSVFWPVVIGATVGTLGTLLVVRRAVAPAPPARPTPLAVTSPTPLPLTGGIPLPAGWQTYRVRDPANPQLHYAVGIPPGYRALFREFGYDVEVVNAQGETEMLVSRYRAPDGQLKISAEGFRVLDQRPFTAGPYVGARFTLQTPPDAFNPNAPVWWNNAQRQEVHLPVPPLKWVFVFTASATVPDEVLDTFAASLQILATP